MTLDSLKTEVESLGPFTPGQVVVIRGDVDTEMLDNLAMWLATSCDDPPLVIRVPEGVSITVLDEDAMRDAGWIKVGSA